ncbi:MAG: hypothetical protein FJ275_11675 [Planctomycetes bacterium]|nr:hypothetical protein [Planctomycetota bacterium]MBM4058867.1 hypothetical protein [Planctomycetota bacterium]
MTSPTLEQYPTQEAARMRLAKLELAEPVVTVVEQPDGTLAGGSLVESARALVKAGLAEDAVSLLAQALTRRAAAWWACRVTRLEAGGSVTPKELRAIEAAEAWVRQPEQLKAYAAQDAANVAGLASPAGCAALAAFLAGDSLAPPHLDPLPPLPHLAGMAAAGAVKLAAARRAPAEPSQELRRMIDAGFAIAAGTDTWEKS